MYKKLKDFMGLVAIVGLIILIKLPPVGAVVLAIGLTFYPFFMLLDKKSAAMSTNQEKETTKE